MRSTEAWTEHAQGRAVDAEPLVHLRRSAVAPRPVASGRAERPLAGVRVLDLTRVLAGPVATRFLAGLGADVLRIDPLDWDEPAIVPEVTLGKRCARLDLGTVAGRDVLRGLLAEADVFVNGYRPGALDRLGLGAAERAAIAPGLVDVCLDAYGWTGPWAGRRGFDSLVQMSCGIAAAGMSATGADRPVPLPVQALDHASGYLVAATVLRGLAERIRTGVGTVATTSLARVARVLMDGPSGDLATTWPAHADFTSTIEDTPWGLAQRLPFAASIEQVPVAWDRPSTRLGSEAAPLRWLGRGSTG